MARASIPIVVLNSPLGIVAGASVSIYRRGSNVPTAIYAAETGSATLQNPVTTDARGRAVGWLERGSYRAVITAQGMEDQTEYFESTPGGDGSIDSAWYGTQSVKKDDLALPFQSAPTGINVLGGVMTELSGKLASATASSAYFYGGNFWISSDTENALLRCVAPNTTISFPAAASGKYRIDAVIVDQNSDGTGTINVLRGTEGTFTAGTNTNRDLLNTRSGAQSVTNRYTLLHLYDVMVRDNGISTTITDVERFREKRKPAGPGILPPKRWTIGYADAPDYAANWADYSSPYSPVSFRKNEDGLVTMQGVVSTTASVAQGANIFYIPNGFLPATTLPFSCASGLAAGFSRVDVSKVNGNLSIQTAMGANTWVSLANISYYATS